MVICNFQITNQITNCARARARARGSGLSGRRRLRPGSGETPGTPGQRSGETPGTQNVQTQFTHSLIDSLIHSRCWSSTISGGSKCWSVVHGGQEFREFMEVMEASRFQAFWRSGIPGFRDSRDNKITSNGVQVKNSRGKSGKK